MVQEFAPGHSPRLSAICCSFVYHPAWETSGQCDEPLLELSHAQPAACHGASFLVPAGLSFPICEIGTLELPPWRAVLRREGIDEMFLEKHPKSWIFNGLSCHCGGMPFAVSSWLEAFLWAQIPLPAAVHSLQRWPTRNSSKPRKQC